MLRHLSVSNYILINFLELNFREGFTTITGETGSGKTILLGALGLIFGDRADTSSLRNKEEKCIIEGELDIAAYNIQHFFEEHDLDFAPITIVRREINPGGKSRAFINDTPVTIAQLKELGESLIDIHSQHEALVLGESRFQRAILDTVAGANKLLDSYWSAYQNYQATRLHLDQLKDAEMQARKELDFDTFLLQELTDADLSEEELTTLEQEEDLLSNASGITDSLARAIYEIHEKEESIADSIQGLSSTIGGVAGSHVELLELQQRLRRIAIELKDIVSEAERLKGTVAEDPERLQFVTERRSSLFGLLHKHHVQHVNQLMELRDALQQKVSRAGSLEVEIAETEERLKKELASVHKVGSELSAKRMKVTDKICKEVHTIIHTLGMRDAVIQIDIQQAAEPGPDGFDTVEFLLKTNKGTEAKPMGKIASGGELSRLMLALKFILCKAQKLPTIIFDEIDTGVSGEIADRMGNIMKTMAETMQVISITHLPQIASKGHTHLKVMKKSEDKQTITVIIELEANERLEEIAGMLSGAGLSDAALDNARVLLNA